MGFGAAEEQFGYYVMVAAVLAVAAAGADLVERRSSLRRPVAVLAVLFTLASVVLGVQSRLVSDGSYLDLRAWLQANVAADERVGLTGDAAVLAFPQYDNAPSLLDLSENDDDYVVTTSKPLLEGYGYAAPELLTWLTANATPVFEVEGPSNGDTVVWRLDRAVVDAAVDAGTTIPAVRTVAP